MTLEHILLGFLQHPASGYELKKLFDDSVRHFWSAELAQIYPALHGLHKRGWVTRSLHVSPKGPQRKVYSRTPAGTRQLLRWVGASPAIGKERLTFLAQVFFMGQMRDLRQTRRFLRELRQHFRQRLRFLKRIDRYHRAHHGRYPWGLDLVSLHYYLTLSFGLARMAASVKWCDESLRRLSKITATYREGPAERKQRSLR
jgi:DNA-binding PadR family transcriptional regulator